MEKWFNRNMRWIILVLFFLLCIKSFQSCSRKTTIRIQEKKLTQRCDSLMREKDNEINSLKKENLEKEFLIIDIKNELKIAGVKYDEAQKRADAVQKTAQSIRANTTIQVNGVEKNK